MTSTLIKQSLLSATLITIGGNVLGRVLGLVREAVFASHFGTSAVFDTFILAFTIPELLGMILFSALPVALIPLVKIGSNESKEDESRLFWSGLVWFGLLFLALSVSIFFFRDTILHWLAPNISGEFGVLGSKLLAVLSFFIFFRGIDIYFRSWCFAKKHFVAPATSTVIVNTIIIAFVFLLYDKFRIETLAYAWLTASIVLLIYNGYFAFKLVRPRIRINLNNRWSLLVVRSLMAVTIVECISMSYPLVDRFLAAHHLGPGPISALRYAATLMSIPGGVFVAAFNLASFPWISQHLIEGQIDRLRSLYVETVRLLIYFMGLISVGVFIFAEDIVRVALQRGEFDMLSLRLTAAPLAVYALGLVFQSIYTFQMRFYYAGRKLVRLGLVLFTMLSVKVVLSVIWVRTYEHEGLVAATVIAYVVGFVIMTYDVGRQLSTSLKILFGNFLPRTFITLTVVGILWYGLDKLWVSESADTLPVLLVRLTLFMVLGISLHLFVGKALNLSEPGRALDALLSRIKRGQ